MMRHKIRQNKFICNNWLLLALLSYHLVCEPIHKGSSKCKHKTVMSYTSFLDFTSRDLPYKGSRPPLFGYLAISLFSLVQYHNKKQTLLLEWTQTVIYRLCVFVCIETVLNLIMPHTFSLLFYHLKTFLFKTNGTEILPNCYVYTSRHKVSVHQRICNSTCLRLSLSWHSKGSRKLNAFTY